MVCAQTAEGEKETEIDSPSQFNMDVMTILYKCIFQRPLGQYNTK